MPAPATDADLAAVVAEQAAKHRIPGLAVGVLHDGRTTVATTGVTSTADPLPVDVDTLFHLGSTTKTLTATALLRLVDDGRLALDSRVTDVLPGFRVADEDATRAVTVQHLLNHTAGWRGDALPRTGFGDDALARAMDDVAAMPQEFAVGQHTSYNNAALLVAGRVLEVLTGTPYEQAVTDLVLTPLAMEGTFFLPWEVAHRRHAVGHVLRGDVEEAVPTWLMHRAMGPAGGAVGSLADQLSYARYHLDGTTTATAPLTEATRALMQQPTSTMRSTLTGVGLTWLLSEHSGVRLVSHGGNVSNLQTSAFHLAPDHGLALVVLGNSVGAAAAGAELLDWCLQHLLGTDPRPGLPILPLSDDLAAEYVGSYDLGAWSVAVTAARGRLFAQMVLPAGSSADLHTLFDRPPTELLLVGPDQFARATDPVEPTSDALRGPDGRVAFFRTGMRTARRLEHP